MFALSQEEFAALISQNAASKGRGGRRKLPHVFTEHGAIMAANVLNSGRAIEVGVYVVRAFVRLREMVATNKEVAARLDELDRKVAGHDKSIRTLVQAIRQLMTPPAKARRSIGFRVEEGRPVYRVRRIGPAR
jgi:ORF6N domain